VALSCAHAEATPATVADAAVASEPAARAKPDPKPAPSCGDATAAAPPPFRWPARGPVTSAFGRRGGEVHEGIDISSRHGMAVRAAAAGTVVFSDRKPGYGRVIFLKHAGGYKTVYAHNQDNLVMKGARVEQGQVIADMGRTGEASGPHLHFEIHAGDRPIDPLACLPARGR
jgi:murein DD-endopeptidase MepM/ murein hydrolase activator NlpD